MTHEALAYIAAGVTLVGLMLYALLGGADFGGGVWDLLASGPRRREQRAAIAHAIGPVWEANHVWLIFVLVMLFTCFPRGYAALGIALFIPFHLALVGIMLRGAAFVFRSFEKQHRTGRSIWGPVFGTASLISPLLLGAAFGAATTGTVQVGPGGVVRETDVPPWLRPYSITCGLLALSTCAYLAAVYLMNETVGELREDFRKRAIISGTTTAAVSAVVLLLARREAHWFFEQILSVRSLPVVGAGLAFFGASAYAVFARKHRLARVAAVGQIILLLSGWGLAQRPYLVYPDLTITNAAGPAETIRFLLLTLPVGGLVLVPSLWLMFRVFKAEPVSEQSNARVSDHEDVS